ncbi:hypothetical protein VTL71DRAFT_6225 [Oculimacula yallundae]|uniref:Uncharacterized protein n=1 Tax=Oculimacula yallundae TaxID=86028 RepID=A0ABR4BZS4_9HELO
MGCPLFPTPKEESKSANAAPQPRRDEASDRTTRESSANPRREALTETIASLVRAVTNERYLRDQGDLNTSITARHTLELPSVLQGRNNPLDEEHTTNSNLTDLRSSFAQLVGIENQADLTRELISLGRLWQRPSELDTDDGVNSEDNELLHQGLGRLRVHTAGTMRNRLHRAGPERAEEADAASLVNNSTATSRREAGTQSQAASNTQQPAPNVLTQSWVGFEGSLAMLNRPRYNDSTFTGALSDHDMSPFPASVPHRGSEAEDEPHDVDRTATPPARSAAPSPTTTRTVRNTLGTDLYQHDPNCPCVDCRNTVRRLGNMDPWSGELVCGYFLWQTLGLIGKPFKHHVETLLKVLLYCLVGFKRNYLMTEMESSPSSPQPNKLESPYPISHVLTSNTDIDVDSMRTETKVQVHSGAKAIQFATISNAQTQVHTPHDADAAELSILHPQSPPISTADQVGELHLTYKTSGVDMLALSAAVSGASPSPAFDHQASDEEKLITVVVQISEDGSFVFNRAVLTRDKQAVIASDPDLENHSVAADLAFIWPEADVPVTMEYRYCLLFDGSLGIYLRGKLFAHLLVKESATDGRRLRDSQPRIEASALQQRTVDTVTRMAIAEGANFAFNYTADEETPGTFFHNDGDDVSSLAHSLRLGTGYSCPGCNGRSALQ